MLLLTFILTFSAPNQAWGTLVQDNQFLASRLQYESLIDGAPEDELANIGWFLTFTGHGPTVELLEASRTVLKRVPIGSAAAEFVLVWMQPMRDFYPDFEELIADTLLEHTPDDLENAPYLILKSSFLMRLAKFRGDETLYKRAKLESRTLNHWLFAPRVGQYPTPDFHKQWKQVDWLSATHYESLNGTVIPPPQVSGSGILHAVTRIRSPKTQMFRARLFSYQDVDVYVDGARLIRHLHREEMGPAIINIRFQLVEGVHEILVKTTQTTKTNGHFQLQFSGEKGIEFLDPQAPSHTVSGEILDVNTHATGLERLLNDYEETEHRGLRKFLTALLDLRKKNLEPAINSFEEMVHEYPDSQLIGGQLIRVYLDGVPFLPGDQQIGRAYSLLEQLNASERMIPENKLLLATVLLKAKQTKEAVFLLQSLVDQNPAYCEALGLLLALVNREGLFDIKTDVMEKIERLGTDHRWGQEHLLKQAQQEGNIEEIKRLLANLRGLFPWGKYEAEYHERHNRYLEAITSLQKQLKFFPNSTYYPYTIAKMYRKRGLYKEQYEWLEKTLLMDPTHNWSLEDIVNIDLHQGEKEKALARLDHYLTLVPHDGTFRQMRSHLQGETYFEPFRVDTAQVIQAAANKPKSIGADSELLLDQLMVRLFPDGSQMRYTHLVTRVLTKKGVDRESEVRLPSHVEVLELRTIKQDGSVYYPEDIQNKSTISLSSISVGDFIDEEHIEYIPPAYYDQDGLDGNMSFIFQGVDRIYHHSECVLIYPDDMAVQPEFYQMGFIAEIEKSERNGLIYVRWLTKDTPPLIPEPAMPNPGQMMPKISFTYNTTWDEVRDFFINVTARNMKLTQRLIKKADEWKTSIPDPRERAKTMYRSICDQIEPEQKFYRNINLTWELKEGNATLLLAALYNRAGLPATVVFTRSRPYENTILDAAYPDLFFRALIRLELPGETIWLDANQKHLAFGYISSDFFGAKALVLDITQPPLTTVPAQGKEFDPIEASYRLIIQPDGSLFGWGEEKFHGLLVSRLIPYYRKLSPGERVKQVEAGVNDRFPESHVENVIIEDEPTPGTFTLSYDFDVKNWARISDQQLNIDYPLPKSPLREHFASLASRKFPVDIDSPILNKAHMILRAPDGYSWVTDNRTTLLETEFGTYELKTIRNSPQELEISRYYQLPFQQIPPEQYTAFQAFCQKILDAEQVKFKAVKQ